MKSPTHLEYGNMYHAPIAFALVVDDFGVKYVRKKHVDHLVNALKKNYKISEDWTGIIYCGITLDWDYIQWTLDISMPGYIKKQLQKYKHDMPKCPKNCPYQPQEKKYGKAAQYPISLDTSSGLEGKEIKVVQQVVGGILWDARSVNMTVLMALSTIVSQQSKATKNMWNAVKQLLDYLASHPDATIRYRASDMVLNIHSDVSYLP